MGHPTYRALEIGFGVVLLVLSLASHLRWFGLYILRLRRHDPYVAVREPKWALATAGFIFMALLNAEAALLVGSWDDWLRRIQLPLILAFVSGPFLVRTFVLYFRYGIAEDLLQWKLIHAEGAPADARPGWFLRNRHLVKGRHLAAILVLWILAVTVVPIAVLDESTSYYYNAASGLVVMPTSWLLAFLFRARSDEYKIKLELYWFIGVGFFGAIAYATVFTNAITRILVRNHIALLVQTCIYSVNLWMLSFVLIGLPKLSTTWTNDSEDEKRQRFLSYYMEGDHRKIPQLDEALNDDDFFEAFKEYLSHEFAAESLVFYKHVVGFESSLTKLVNGDGKISPECIQELITESFLILETYIKEGSPLEINVSYTIRDVIKKNVQSLYETVDFDNPSACLKLFASLFVSAKVEVLTLLQNDNLRRFINSQTFEDLSRKKLNLEIVVKKHDKFLEATLSKSSLPSMQDSAQAQPL